MILEPVIDGVSKLKKAAQLGVVSQAINAFCEAWKNNILKHKIKFRSGLIHKTFEPTLTLALLYVVDFKSVRFTVLINRRNYHSFDSMKFGRILVCYSHSN